VSNKEAMAYFGIWLGGQRTLLYQSSSRSARDSNWLPHKKNGCLTNARPNWL